MSAPGLVWRYSTEEVAAMYAERGLEATVDAIVERAYGRHQPTAHKRGRNKRWPYVPVVLEPLDTPAARAGEKLERYDYRQRQLLGLAYATREEAIAVATREIAGIREALRAKLLSPEKGRAWRTWLGLPRELVGGAA